MPALETGLIIRGSPSHDSLRDDVEPTSGAEFGARRCKSRLNRVWLVERLALRSEKRSAAPVQPRATNWDPIACYENLAAVTRSTRGK